LHVDENMPFLALDHFARIEPVRIIPGPSFSALFTLWLSMMQAVGQTSRSAFSHIRRTVHDGSDCVPSQFYQAK
jgi:hypothetical protein